MRTKKPLPAPLELAKLFGVSQIEIAIRLRNPVTENWLRVLALRPDRADEIRIAELEAIIDHLRARRMVESALSMSGAEKRP
jgi:hypothetical protein